MGKRVVLRNRFAIGERRENQMTNSFDAKIHPQVRCFVASTNKLVPVQPLHHRRCGDPWMPGASMLRLRELQVLRCECVVERETGRLWENWLVAKTAFPPLDGTCPVHARK